MALLLAVSSAAASTVEPLLRPNPPRRRSTTARSAAIQQQQLQRRRPAAAAAASSLAASASYSSPSCRSRFLLTAAPAGAAAGGAGGGARRAGFAEEAAGGGPVAVRAGLGDYNVTTAAAYGATLLLGGLFAFARTGSKGSLGGGLTGALLYGATWYLLQSASTEALGNAIGFGTGLLFSAVFAIRLFATGKPVPAGPLLALSLGATAVFAAAYFA